MYKPPEYKPIDNLLVEYLLDACKNNRNDDDIKKFADHHLMPKKEGLYGPSYDATLYLITESLKFLLIKNGEDRRKIGNHLNSKHPIDTAMILLAYDLANKIDYKTIIVTEVHDLPEEDKKTEDGIKRKASVLEIRSFLEETIRNMPFKPSLKLEYIAEKKEDVINEVSTIITPLIDPFYDNLHTISLYSKAIPKNYEEDKDIKDLVDLAINEKKDFDFYINLKSIIRKIKITMKKDSYYLYRYPKLGGIINRSDNTEKNYMKFGFNTFNPDEELIKTGLANKIIYIKFADKISQNFEIVEKEPSKEDSNYKDFQRKHEIIKAIGQEELDQRKKKLKNESDILIYKKEKKNILEDITLGEYNFLQDLKISGSQILTLFSKNFVIEDFGTRFINKVYFGSEEPYDATMLNLRNGLAYTTLKEVNNRINHLIEYNHINKSIARKIQKGVEQYEDIFRLTNKNTEYDIFRNYHLPAMKGNYEMISTLNYNKRKQLIQLEIFKRIFEIYLDNINVEIGKKLEKELPIFGWGRFLNKFYNNGK